MLRIRSGSTTRTLLRVCRAKQRPLSNSWSILGPRAQALSGHGTWLAVSGAFGDAAQQRPEADADLATLDPRSLGLLRWADDMHRIQVGVVMLSTVSLAIGCTGTQESAPLPSISASASSVAPTSRPQADAPADTDMHVAMPTHGNGTHPYSAFVTTEVHLVDPQAFERNYAADELSSYIGRLLSVLDSELLSLSTRNPGEALIRVDILSAKPAVVAFGSAPGLTGLPTKKLSRALATVEAPRLPAEHLIFQIRIQVTKKP